MIWCDSEIFEHYGVDLPTGDWTFADVLEIAKKLTGTDPVTGQETYGIQLDAMGQNNLWFNYVLCANSLGATVYAEARELVDHHRMPYAEVRITDEQGRLVAIFTSGGYRKSDMKLEGVQPPDSSQ